jgi:hypothetical protein
MEGEGISDVRDYFRKQLVTLGVLKPTEEEAQQLAEMQQQAQQPTPEQQYLLSQAQKTLAEVEKIKAEAQKLATEYNPATVQLERDFETQKLVMENERERMKVEIARLQAEVAQVKALSELEGERERTRATIEAPRPTRIETSVPPMVVVDNEGNVAKVVKPTIDAMTMALGEANAAIEGLVLAQEQMIEQLQDVRAQATRRRSAKVVVRKRPDGSYEGERIED